MALCISHFKEKVEEATSLIVNCCYFEALRASIHSMPSVQAAAHGSKYVGIGWRRTAKGQSGWYTQWQGKCVGGLVSHIAARYLLRVCFQTKSVVV